MPDSFHKFSAPNPDYEDLCRESFRQQGIMRTLGATMRVLEPGRCIIDLPFHQGLTQQDGYFHGGVTSTIADSAGGYAALSVMPAGSRILTVEFKINMLSPANGTILSAEGNVIKAGRSLAVTRIDVSVERDGDSVPCAIVQQTAMRIAATDE